MTDNDMATVALCPICGHVTAASIDRFSTPSETRKMSNGWIKRGDIVDHITAAQVRAHGWCDQIHAEQRREIEQRVEATRATA